ncbi:MAG: response regulator [Pyrinomonadaceae bacterium]|nr:response regulator [Pyrinomonadaceae bacterium]
MAAAVYGLTEISTVAATAERPFRIAYWETEPVTEQWQTLTRPSGATYSAYTPPFVGLTPFKFPSLASKYFFKMATLKEIADLNENEIAPRESLRGATQGDMPGSRARVLLVEDDSALRRYVEVTLQRAGYEVLSAADGLEGMKLALTSSVDIVITDAMMPNLSGHELCRFLRNSPQLAHIPIVFLSGMDRKEGSREEEYADAVFSKPVSGEDLTGCVAELLRARK